MASLRGGKTLRTINNRKRKGLDLSMTDDPEKLLRKEKKKNITDNTATLLEKTKLPATPEKERQDDSDATLPRSNTSASKAASKSPSKANVATTTTSNVITQESPKPTLRVSERLIKKREDSAQILELKAAKKKVPPPKKTPSKSGISTPKHKQSSRKVQKITKPKTKNSLQKRQLESSVGTETYPEEDSKKNLDNSQNDSSSDSDNDYEEDDKDNSSIESPQ